MPGGETATVGRRNTDEQVSEALNSAKFSDLTAYEEYEKRSGDVTCSQYMVRYHRNPTNSACHSMTLETSRVQVLPCGMLRCLRPVL